MIGNGWHVVEFTVAVAAGVAAASTALVAFGLDSLIELASGGVIIWLTRADRDAAAERRAQRLVAASYGLLVVYIAAAVTASVATGRQPSESTAGIILAACAVVMMPLLAAAKRRAGRRIGSAAAVSEAGQNLLCAYLSVALLVGLCANAAFGWWWADPAAAVVIGVVAAREGVEAWRGEQCGCAAGIDEAVGAGRESRCDDCD